MQKFIKRKIKSKPLKDPKAKIRHYLIKKLDTIFSKYIRLRDSNSEGIGFCITCGKPGYWKYMDCGHFIKRQHMSTRYDEKNCNLQCKGCNCFEQGADALYTLALEKKYGPGTSLLLLEMRNHRTRYPVFYFEKLIKEYTKKVDVLMGEIDGRF